MINLIFPQNGHVELQKVIIWDKGIIINLLYLLLIYYINYLKLNTSEQ